MRRLAVAALLLLTGCANEKNFVKYHTKEPGITAGHCAIWHPHRDSTIIKVITKKGETVTLPGEIEYINYNCDSAVMAALDEASKTNTRIPVRVRVRVDTFDRQTVVFRENTAMVTSLNYKLGISDKKADKYQAAYNKTRTRANYMAAGYGFLLLLAMGWGYFKLQSQYLNKIV